MDIQSCCSRLREWRFKILTVILVMEVGIVIVFLSLAVIGSKQENTPKEDLKNLVNKIYKISRDNDLFPSQSKGNKKKELASLEFLNLIKPVGQLSGFTAKVEVPTERTIRNWAINNYDDGTFLWNGMKYEHGSISVPATGTYLVYSHMNFYVQFNETLKQPPKFYHKILRYVSSTGKQILLCSEVLGVRSCNYDECNGPTCQLVYPSVLRRLVTLTVGDQISVKVRGQILANYGQGTQFFGIYITG